MTVTVGRRTFLAGLGSAAVACSFAARAQEPGRIYRIGFLIPTPRDRPAVAALFDELQLHGFVEHQNLEVLPGGFGVRNEELTELAADLVKAAPDAIVAGPELPLRTLRAATRTVPLIGLSEDLVAEGLADSLAHPGGNITGISLLSPELDGKRQEILIEAVPAARQIAAMFDAEVTQPYHLQMLQHAARSRGVKLSILGVNGPEEIAAAIDGAKALGVEALNFLATPLFSVPGSRNNQIVLERLATVRLPAIFQWPETAEAGAVLVYGPRFTDVYRQRGRIVAKVLRGSKPAEIPVEQPTRFELVLNLKAAKIIDHQVPAGLVARADKVVE
jgi:putative tryptophan/tyrosine transport system substrate-binding protein